jgi:hypothetical protein
MKVRVRRRRRRRRRRRKTAGKVWAVRGCCLK